MPVWARRHGLPTDGRLWQRWLLAAHPRQALLRALAALNQDAFRQGRNGPADRPFLAALPNDLRGDLQQVLAGRGTTAPGAPRVLFSRQGVLRAVRAVCTAEADDPPPPPPGLNGIDPLVAAGLLVHTVADRMGAPQRAGEPRLGGLPQTLAMEIVRNHLFHQVDQPRDLLARTRRLWRDYGPRAAAATGLRADPWDLLTQAIGTDPDDALALTFALYAHSTQRQPGDPVALDIRARHRVPPASVDAYLDRFAATHDGLAAAFAASPGQDSDWDLLPVQDRPLLRDGDHVTVLDSVYLLQRFTTGLYWLVHDNEKATGGDPARQAWAAAWGHMTELLAEDTLRALAPERGPDGRANYYDEHDFGAAYGGKRADAGIDYGRAFLIAEVFSGGPTVPTRVHGDADAFRRDINKMVLEKASQLDQTATGLNTDPPVPGGPVPRPPARILPLVVEGAGFPVSPFTTGLIRQEIDTLGYLQQPNTEPIGIVDLADLELLHSVQLHHGHTALATLDDWRRSRHARDSLRAYIHHRYAGQPLPAPPAAQAALDDFFTDVLARLDLDDDDDDDETAPPAAPQHLA